MSFDYSSDSQRLNLPNPLKVENLFLFIIGGLFALLGLTLLLIGRAGITEHAGGGKIGGIIVAISMLLVGIAYIGKALAQLRFYFGRGLPQNIGLIPEMPSGDSAAAAELRKTMMQQALHYEEPKGALNGILYSLLPNLIFAPPPVRHFAQSQFKNAIVLGALLLSLTITMLTGGAGLAPDIWERVSTWIGIIFIAYSMWILVKGSGLDATVTQVEGDLGIGKLVGLIAFSVLGPILLGTLGQALPPVKIFSPYPQAFIILLVPIGTFLLVFFALLQQLPGQPRTAIARNVEAWSINCNPSLILGEFRRVMMANWSENIPNRLYSNIEPVINLTLPAGEFRGLMLEETQPLPATQEINLSVALSQPRYKPILLLNVFGSIAYAICAAMLFVLGYQAIGNQAEHIPSLLIYALIFGALGMHAFRSAHALWMRFDFRSYLIWLEMNGQYVTAKMEHGNMMRDSIKTSSAVTKIESMTFTLWIAVIDSVTFGKTAQRHIISLGGDSQYCEDLTRHFRTFAENQAIILAPVGQADMERHQSLAGMNALSQAAAAKASAQGSALPSEEVQGFIAAQNEDEQQS